MKWTLIGTGWITERFLKSLKNNGEEIVGIISRSRKSGEEFAKKHEIANVFLNLEEDNISEVVYIGTPNTTHYEFAKNSLLLNKHVMVEKPMTHKYELTKELYALGKEKNLQVMEAYAHITQPFFNGEFEVKNELKCNYKQLSSKIKNNTFKEASSFSRKYFGGVVPDLGVYPISIAVYINGDVETIKVTNPKMTNDVVSECDIELTHTNGIVSKIGLSKLVDGDNALYLDDKLVLKDMNFVNNKNKMDCEVQLFINNRNLDLYEKISCEVARIVEEIDMKLYSN